MTVRMPQIDWKSKELAKCGQMNGEDEWGDVNGKYIKEICKKEKSKDRQRYERGVRNEM